MNSVIPASKCLTVPTRLYSENSLSVKNTSTNCVNFFFKYKIGNGNIKGAISLSIDGTSEIQPRLLNIALQK